ncbi:MAG: gliding motility-associated C-terminal domain-containing protein [Saprospiraceae bacterium]|nr:gliding motility-associated C-terminal domain-containing protein [Saprospiraceae bacterium]
MLAGILFQTLDWKDSNPLCAGNDNGTIVINELSSNQEITYFLNGVKTEILTIENLESGNYNVTAINEFGCETDSGIILEEAEAISLDIGADLNITLGEEVLINLISDIPNDSILSTVWTLPDGQVINGRLFSVTVKGESSGILTLIITDKNGCTAESSIRISIKETEIEVEIPNVILVGSSSNNLFTIAPNPGILLVKECFIYDRWGNKVYSVENSQPGSFAWDGTFAGSECQQGVYVYKVLLRLASGEEKLFAGDLTLLR